MRVLGFRIAVFPLLFLCLISCGDKVDPVQLSLEKTIETPNRHENEKQSAKEQPMNIKKDAIERLMELAAKDNFDEDQRTFYPGPVTPEDGARLNAQFRKSIQQFVEAVQRGATKEEFLRLLRTEVDEFDSVDSEDRDQIGHNFEKIMESVGLKSSEGILNTWRYGFDPDNMTPERKQELKRQLEKFDPNNATPEQLEEMERFLKRF